MLDRFRAPLVIATFAAAIAVAGCIPPRKEGSAPEVDAAMVARAQASDAKVDAARLTHGREMLMTRCTECHKRPGPESEDADDWPSVAERMGKKAKMEPDDRQAMLAYLLAARAPEPAKQ